MPSAYYVTEQGIDAEALKKRIATKLPDYMIPQYFIELDELPLTNNGKINVRALPDIMDTSVFIPPKTKLEKTLTAIWSKVLNIPEERIGITDEFFRLGGNSIKAIRMVSEAKLKGIELQTKGYLKIQQLIISKTY